MLPTNHTAEFRTFKYELQNTRFIFTTSAPLWDTHFLDIDLGPGIVDA
jgi:hypothetical protein